MAYFVNANPRHERDFKAGQRHGIRSHNVTQTQMVNPLRMHPTNDEVKSHEAQKMTGAPDLLMYQLDKTKGRRVSKAKIVDTTLQRTSHAFDGPKEDPRPTPRVRTGVTDEDLMKIWAEDDRKDRAARAMEQAEGGDLVSHMVADHRGQGVNAKSKEAPVNRKGTGALSLVDDEHNAAQPMGFKGMGGHCAPEKYGRGPRPAPSYDYEAPAFADVIKKRQQGRKIIAPPDTFNFDESQDPLKIVPDRAAYGFRVNQHH